MIKLFRKNDVKTLGDILRKKHLTIGTAESCTAGGIGAKIASISGASDYFRGGIISYATDIKETILGVNSQTIKDHDVVSKETAVEMAKGAAKVLNVDIAISITGYAGRTGGNDKVPNGTIWLCAYDSKKDIAIVKKLILHKGRKKNLDIAKKEAIKLAISLINV